MLVSVSERWKEREKVNHKIKLKAHVCRVRLNTIDYGAIGGGNNMRI